MHVRGSNRREGVGVVAAFLVNLGQERRKWKEGGKEGVRKEGGKEGGKVGG